VHPEQPTPPIRKKNVCSGTCTITWCTTDGSTGTNFNGIDPGVFFEWTRNEKALNFPRSFRWNRNRLRDRDDHVRLNPPSILPFDCGRLICRIAFRCSVVGPAA
jgi:hypothetical protein